MTLVKGPKDPVLPTLLQIGQDYCHENTKVSPPSTSIVVPVKAYLIQKRVLVIHITILEVMKNLNFPSHLSQMTASMKDQETYTLFSKLFCPSFVRQNIYYFFYSGVFILRPRPKGFMGKNDEKYIKFIVYFSLFFVVQVYIITLHHTITL